jgi:hypothetical protein
VDPPRDHGVGLNGASFERSHPQHVLNARQHDSQLWPGCHQCRESVDLLRLWAIDLQAREADNQDGNRDRCP